MKKLMILSIALMLSGVLTCVTLAASQNEKTTTPPEESQLVLKKQYQDKQGKHKAESEARRLQKAYFMKREAAKIHRDTAAELRRQNIESGNPGNTGM